MTVSGVLNYNMQIQNDAAVNCGIRFTIGIVSAVTNLPME